MKILVAPDSFKGCCTAAEAARFMSSGIRTVCPDAQITELPAADGGEGTVDSLVDALGGKKIFLPVTGPMGETVTANYALLPGGMCALEMASASGLPLVPRDRRNPLVATSRGTGEVIRAALDQGCRKFLVGIGGSATNDAGAGMMQALGVSFRDAEGREIGPGGAELARVEKVDLSGMDPRIAESEFLVACDVKNPLCGPQGSSAVYGPQKGATPEMVAQLDAALRHLAYVVRRDLHKEFDSVPGYGAAGGLGAALSVFCGGTPRSGISTVLDLILFDERVKDCDLVVTGEGSIDSQSVFGKVPVGVGQRAKQNCPGIPVVAIVGNMKPGAEKVYGCGVDVIMPTTPGPVPLDEAIAKAPEFLAGAAERMMRLLKAAERMYR